MEDTAMKNYPCTAALKSYQQPPWLHSGIKCDHLSENLCCSHKYANWEIKFLNENLHMVPKKCTVFISQKKSKTQFDKNYLLSYFSTHGELENLCSPNSMRIACVRLQCGRQTKLLRFIQQYCLHICMC